MVTRINGVEVQIGKGSNGNVWIGYTLNNKFIMRELKGTIKLVDLKEVVRCN